MVAADPWEWTVDDLVSHVCRSRVLFNDAGFGPSNCPDPQVFEAPLRTHQVAGAAFLTGINDITLRDDLGIQSLGQRQALLAVVRLLRSRSLQYKQNDAVVGPAITNPNGRKKRRASLTTVSRPTGAFEHHPATQALPANKAFSGTHNKDIENRGGQWDHLLRWEDIEYDEIVGSDMEVDAEEGYDSAEAEETQDEIQDTMDADETILPENEPRGRKVSKTDLVNMVNESLARYTEAWFPGKQAAEDQPVNIQKLWDKVGTDEQRQQLVKAKKQNVEYYEYRLDLLGEEIFEATWKNRDEAKRGCQSLQVTVELLEYEKWLVELYESNDKEPQTQSMSDIIDLGSGSDSSSIEEEPVSETELVCATDKLSFNRNSPSTSATATANMSRPTMVETGQPRPDRTRSPLQGTREPKSPQSQSDHFSHHEPVLSRRNVPQPSQTQKRSQAQSLLPLNDSYEDHSRGTSERALLHNKESPELASISTVGKWRWDHLKQQSDRKRIVMKVVHEMNDGDREVLRMRVTTVRKQNLLMEIPLCIEMLLRGDNKIKGILPRDLEKIIKFTKLFFSWWLADNYLYKDINKWQLEELAQCLQEHSEDPDTFYAWTKYILETTFSKDALARPNAPSQAEIILISDSDSDA